MSDVKTYKSGPVEVARDVLITDLDGNPLRHVSNARISLGDIQREGDTVSYEFTITATGMEVLGNV